MVHLLWFEFLGSKPWLGRTGKSILVRYKVGKKFFYKATMNKREMAMEAVNEVAGQFFNKDYAQMIRFIESEFDLVK